jgi:predicted DNA-binding antitoxin AbrB/MazE fold protein
MTLIVHATYHDGLIHPASPLNLPEGTELKLTIETADRTRPDAATKSPARIFSPRLAHPEQITDFQMEIREISDAGV